MERNLYNLGQTYRHKNAAFIVGLFLTLLAVIAMVLFAVYETEFYFLTIIIAFSILSIYSLKQLKKEGLKSIFNARFLFSIIMFLYINLYPICYLVFKMPLPNILPIHSATIKKATILCNISFCLFVLLACRLKIDGYKKTQKMAEDQLQNILPSGRIVLFDLFVAFYVLSYLFQIIRIGAISSMLSGINRIDSGSLGVHTYFIFDYIFIAYASFVGMLTIRSAVNKKRANIGMAIRMIFIILVFALNIILGERRKFLYVLLFWVFSYLICKNFKIKKRGIVLLILFLLAFIMVGYLRNTGYKLQNDASFAFFSAFGEFFIPINTLYYYMDNGVQFAYGASFLIPLFFLIPRMIWPGKPNSLGVNFANIFGGEMGYGFTPLTETFVNFGFLGFAIFPFLLIALIFCVEKWGRKYSFIYIVFLTECLNFNRGEFSAVFIEMAIFCSVHFLLTKYRVSQPRPLSGEVKA